MVGSWKTTSPELNFSKLIKKSITEVLKTTDGKFTKTSEKFSKLSD